MFFLNISDIISINKCVIRLYGGIYGIQDLKTLEGITSAMRTSLYENINYKKGTIYDTAAQFAFSVIKNNPFIDGNKRTALAGMITFLKLNDHDISYNQEKAIENILKIANNETSLGVISNWLISGR